MRSLHNDGVLVCEDAHEPLVTHELVDRAQRMLRRERRADVVFVQDVADALGVHKAFTSRLLAQAVLSGKIETVDHRKGCTAVE